MGLFGFFQARDAACEVCGTGLPEAPLEAFGKRFHSTLCLRYFERHERRRQRAERRRDGATAANCVTCSR